MHKIAQEQIGRSPTSPGVYLFKNAAGKVLYVGKAKNLRNRLKSYLHPARDERPSVAILVPQIAQVECLVMDTEKEALLVENSLIKAHTPHYNIMLRDDKSYVSLRLTKHEFPRLFMTRNIVKDGSEYFGPYASAADLRQTLKLLQKIFLLRDCTDSFFENRSRPCLQYQIRRCSGPCVGYVTPDGYAEQIREAKLFLKGEKANLIQRLQAGMAGASGEQRYEEAAQYRDRISAVNETLEPQRVQAPGEDADADAIGLAGDADATLLKLLKIRDGRIVASEEFFVTEPVKAAPEIVRAFLQQIYLSEDSHREIPSNLLLPIRVSDSAVFESLLSERRKRKVHLLNPKRGRMSRLLRLAEKNAALALGERKRRSEQNRGVLEQLQQRFELPAFPKRIEGYDISAFHGAEPVGSMVVFIEGEADKTKYRHYGIRTVKGSNDFAMLREMFERRFSKMTEADRPDLILVDGGRGQLKQIVDVLAELGIHDLPVLSIAKEKELRSRSGKRYAPERIFVPGQKNPIIFPPSSILLRLFQRIRDEAHRFGITRHRKARGRTALKSVLQRVPGIGAKRQRILLRAFASLEQIQGSSAEQIAEKSKIPLPVAAEIVRFFGRVRVDSDE